MKKRLTVQEFVSDIYKEVLEKYPNYSIEFQTKNLMDTENKFYKFEVDTFSATVSVIVDVNIFYD